MQPLWESRVHRWTGARPDGVKTGFGKVGSDYTADEAYRYARHPASWFVSPAGNGIEAGAPVEDPFSIVKKLVKMTGFVTASQTFTSSRKY